VPVTISTPWPVRGTPRRFHISLPARQRYAISDELVTLRGDVMLLDANVCAQVAAAVERLRSPQEPPLVAADLLAGAVLEEVYHLLIAHHRQHVDAALFERSHRAVRAELGDDCAATLEAFVQRYPNREVARGALTPAAYLALRQDDLSGAEVVLEEMVTCFLANVNPALAGARPLVDDAPLRARSAYERTLAIVRDGLGHAPGVGGSGGSLFDDLLAPMRAAPNDLRGQLRFVRERWGGVLGVAFDGLVGTLLGALDALEETHRQRGGGGTGAGGPGPGYARELIAGLDAIDERFSPDASWMPRVVLMAKNTYVWLDQLTRRYQREIRRLEQIPDEALAELAGRGITGLWLIGLWERSPASRTVKVLRGQADAVASAYALYDYVIADDLGGEAGYRQLRDAAARHGIRLASDMVPNHVGIDGRWVVDHPDWFVQLDHPPYPGYRFDGPELSTDPRVSVKIEDGYYDDSDAAVVFQRRDRHTGETRFIYHGNDGTAMPWNDTAQLDYLQPAVREAVIQTILAVAKRFPIIRFDAAMTLARRHVRRLWYPEPGEGGAIPSRGRYGAMSDEAFAAAMPHEFWREVVDRVAAEAPDTLLLAEAFWMMEGYFVRTLGMHRVYNSAFMHMTKAEDGRGYRGIVKETLAFDPQILKRFVNFMNNPDEESARVQFGDGDKYFAVATLLATMPGLPMLGHGQFEGYREKYGMEFRAPRLDEQPDERLLARQSHELVPLLHRRAQFADVERFRLYDLVADDGSVIEDVYAYSNHGVGSTSLVVVNLRYPHASGTIRTSVPYRPSAGAPEEQQELAAAFGLHGGPDRFVVMHDSVAGLTYLHPSDELQRGGLRVRLDGYERRVFVDVHERVDHDGRLARLHAQLQGAGTPALGEALDELRLERVHAAFKTLLAVPPFAADDLAVAWRSFVTEGPVTAGERALRVPTAAAWERLQRTSEPALLSLAWALHLVSHAAWPLQTWRDQRLGRVVTRRLAAAGTGVVPARLGEVVLVAFEALGREWPTNGVLPDAATWLQHVLRAEGAESALGVNEHAGVRWFRRESVLACVEVAHALLRLQRPGAAAASAARAWRRRVEAVIEASGYRVDGVVSPAQPPLPRRKQRTGAKSARATPTAERASTSDAATTRPRRRGRP